MLSKWFSVFGVACVLASSALFAQDFAIDGKDFESGSADAKLAEIARQAASSGKTVVVSTPPYWQAKVAGKLRAAAPGLQVKTSDAFFENVLVRIVDVDKTTKADTTPKSAETQPKAAEPAAQPKPAQRAETKLAATAEQADKESQAAKAEPAQVALARPVSPPAPASVQAPKPSASKPPPTRHRSGAVSKTN